MKFQLITSIYLRDFRANHDWWHRRVMGTNVLSLGDLSLRRPLSDWGISNTWRRQGCPLSWCLDVLGSTWRVVHIQGRLIAEDLPQWFVWEHHFWKWGTWYSSGKNTHSSTICDGSFSRIVRLSHKPVVAPFISLYLLQSGDLTYWKMDRFSSMIPLRCALSSGMLHPMLRPCSLNISQVPS